MKKLGLEMELEVVLASLLLLALVVVFYLSHVQCAVRPEAIPAAEVQPEAVATHDVAVAVEDDGPAPETEEALAKFGLSAKSVIPIGVAAKTPIKSVKQKQPR